MKQFLFLLFIFYFSISSAQQKPEPIRGTWITNVASHALLSEKNIKEAVKLCKQKRLNNIYVVVWNGGVTMYPSEVVQSYIGIKQHPVYKGFDPIKTIIKEGHKLGLKVHAWFEFGFSYAYKDTAGSWLKKYPHWAGRNNKGELLQKNGFYWWSAIHPEVQTFMKKLVLEVVHKYKIDGVQGDDRLPAMPGEGGYDSTTVALYKKETGKDAPADSKEKDWQQWKADKLSVFGKELYSEIKKAKPGCMVSWAPSIYPWSKEQYLQDWPAWLNGGYADYILPQLYRYNIEAYEKILKELDSQLTAGQKKKVFPGILTSLGDGYLIKPEMLQQIIQLNRQYGFEGECMFYFETLRRLKGPIYKKEQKNKSNTK
jgi:uncharacterized lipoprotein YddW (UPF0748 family)